MQGKKFQCTYNTCSSHTSSSPTRLASLEAFTLLELTIVIAIIAGITAASVSMGRSMIDSAQRVQTRNKLDAIEDALMAYRVANKRLPCPADPRLLATNANYGVEAANKGTCTGGTPALPATNSYTIPAPPSTTLLPGGTTAVEGAVPFKALNLPAQFMYDAWGRKFSYAVWTPLTAANAFVTYGIQPSCGAITVKDAGGTSRSSRGAVYTLMSYGPDGHGGYLASGARYNAGSTNADEQTNAHYSQAGADTNGYTATYIQKEWTQSSTDSANVFDDMVRFKERWQMATAYDDFSPTGAPCSNGFIVNGYTAGSQFEGLTVTTGDVNGDGIADLIIGSSDTGVSPGYGAVYVVFGTKSGFQDPLSLSSLNGVNGFELDGVANALAGWSLATADVNGDGIADIIIGAQLANSRSGNPSGNGDVYVVFGHTGTWNTTPQSLNSAFLNGTNGFELDGMAKAFKAGFSVAGGDVNGDGIADILIGAPQAGSFYATGSVTFSAIPTDGQYIILNGVTWTFKTTCTGGNTQANCASHYQTDIQADYKLTATQLATELGLSADALLTGAGYAANNLGQMNIIYKTMGTAGNSYTLCINGGVTCNSNHYIGDPNALASGTNLTNGYSNGGLNDQGAVYVVYGGKTGAGNSAGTAWTSCIPCTLNSTFLNGINGVEFDGTATNEFVGDGLATGDLNGDGTTDFAIGTGINGGGITNNQAFVVFGKSLLLPKTTVITTNGSPTATVGSASGLIVGQTVSSASFPAAGLTINAISGTTLTLSGNATATDATGTVAMYVSAEPLNSTYLNGTYGVEFDTTNASSGAFALAIGDVNGDGTKDLLIGSEAYNTGYVYVIFGKSSGWPTSAQALNTTWVNGINAVEYSGVVNGDRLGLSVATGDVNGDGVSDTLTIANSGSYPLYAVFGKSILMPQTTITTTAGSASATVGSYAGLMAGQTISASTIPAGRTISSCGGSSTVGTLCTSTSITLSSGSSVTAGSNTTMYVTIQPATTTFINGTNGVELDGVRDGTNFGVVNIAAGDISGDGIADVIGTNSYTGASYDGSVYVYFGKNNGWPTSPYALSGM